MLASGDAALIVAFNGAYFSLTTFKRQLESVRDRSASPHLTMTMILFISMQERAGKKEISLITDLALPHDVCECALDVCVCICVRLRCAAGCEK